MIVLHDSFAQQFAQQFCTTVFMANNPHYNELLAMKTAMHHHNKTLFRYQLVYN